MCNVFIWTWVKKVMDVMDWRLQWFYMFFPVQRDVWAILPSAEAMHLGHLLPFMFTQCLGHANEVAQHVGVMQVQLQPSHD